MSTKAILKIDGKLYHLRNLHYSFKRYVGPAGYPTNLVRFEQISFLISEPADVFFLSWMFSPTIHKSGTISFYEDEEMEKKIKQLIFGGAFCISYKEKFNNSNNQNTVAEITLSAGGVKLGESAFRFPWFRGPLVAKDEFIMDSVVEYLPVETIPHVEAPVKKSVVKSLIKRPAIPLSTKLAPPDSFDKQDYINGQIIEIERNNIGLSEPEEDDFTNSMGYFMYDKVSKTKFAYVTVSNNPTAGPELTIFSKKAKINKADLLYPLAGPPIQVIAKAKDFSHTEEGIDAMIQLHKKKHGVPPDNLPGNIAEDNLANVRKEYLKLKKMAINKTLGEKELIIEAIKKTSFGIHRVNAGYKFFDLDLGDRIPIIIDGETICMREITKINSYLKLK